MPSLKSTGPAPRPVGGGRRVLKHNRDKPRTRGQADYIRKLRKRAGEPRDQRMPKTRGQAAREIDRLLIKLGRKPKTNTTTAKPRNTVRLEVSVQRDLAHLRLREQVRTEQADLKAQAAARRAAAG